MNRFLILIFEIIILTVILYFRSFHQETIEFLESNHAISSIVTYVIFLIMIDFLSVLTLFIYSKRNRLKSNVRDNFHFGIGNISRLLIGIGFIVMLFGVFGVDFKSLLTSISIVAAAIAIISRDFINDFLVGIYFSFSKNFEIGDYVKIIGHKGKIVEILMLKIKLLNDDDDLVIIPNGKVYTDEITNYTKRDIRLMSIDFQLDIKVIENIERFEKELILSLESFSKFIEESSYALKIVEMKKDYLDLKFQYTLKQLDREMQRNIRKKTVREVFNYISGKNKKEAEGSSVQ